MDIRQALLAEHSKKQCQRIVSFVGNDPARFKDLVQLFLGDEYRVIQRAAWPVSYCIEEYPELIKPYWSRFIKCLGKKDTHPAVARNVMRLLQFTEIPKRYQGPVLNACFDYIADPQQAPAVKAFSLTVLYNLYKVYPDILPEIQSIIEAAWDRETPAFRARARVFRNLKA